MIELKRDDAPRATIGQIAGYIAFVKKILAKPKGRSVVGWILARPSSPTEDRVLEESANAVGIVVKWYSMRLEFLEGKALIRPQKGQTLSGTTNGARYVPFNIAVASASPTTISVCGSR